MAVILLAAYLVSRALQRQISEPILALAKTARAISDHHDFSVRAVKRGDDELGLLTDAFNQLLTQIHAYKAALDEHAIVAITDPRGRITYVNDKFCAISKYSREELLGQDHRIINSSHHPRDFIRGLWTTIARGQVWKGEIKNRAKDGSIYWVDTTIVPFLKPDGKPYQYVAIRADVTRRKLVEEEIRRLNQELEARVVQRTAQLQAANKELEAFSYSVSHDLRAPLRHIDGFAGLLVKSDGQTISERGKRHLANIADSAQQMGRLIDDLLVFSRMGRTDMNITAVDLSAVVEETIRSLQPETSQRRIVWQKAPLPTVQADPPMLRQVFVNLLANAVKYTRPRDPAVIEIGSHETDGEVVVHVRDNGVGFEMEYRDKLFGVFQRLHRSEEFEGTGIGLANVRRIVNRHGGRTWAESTPGQGATFYFSLSKTKLSPASP
jgi:PAS domain S-box-containing protein